MSIKKLADEIQSIHDSGDCGKSLSDVLEMAIELNNKPSDLEIVQKALIKCDYELSFDYGGGYTLFMAESVMEGGDDLESLLTWAKKTLWMEI